MIGVKSFSYIILGSTRKMTQYELQYAGQDGKIYVQQGEEYEVEDCLETMQAVILAMESSEWFVKVERTGDSFVKFNQPMESAHSFQVEFDKKLKSILKIPTGGPCTKKIVYVSLLKSNEKKDGMWMYKIVHMHAPLSLEPQLNEEVTSGNGVRYHVQDYGIVKCKQGKTATNIPLLSYRSTTDVDGLTVYHVSPLAEEAFETAFAFWLEKVVQTSDRG